ncbi:MAG: ankyrin repeat domain-containing protein, partial [Gammaproteobacteria bacterium]
VNMDAEYFETTSYNAQYEYNRIDGNHILPALDHLSCQFSTPSSSTPNTSVSLRVINEALKKLTPSAEVIHFKCAKLVHVNTYLTKFCDGIPSDSKNLVILNANAFNDHYDPILIVKELNKRNSFVILDNSSAKNESVFELLERVSQYKGKPRHELPQFLFPNPSFGREDTDIIEKYCDNIATKAREKLVELRNKAFTWDENPTERLFKMIANAYSLEEIQRYIETNSLTEYTLKTLINRNGYGLVHYAARYGRVDLLKHLNHQFISLNAINQINGNNALHVAAFYNQKEVADYLTRENNFDFDASNVWGDTAFKIITQKYNLKEVAIPVPETLAIAITNTIAKLIKEEKIDGLQQYLNRFDSASGVIQTFIKAKLSEKFNELSVDLINNAQILFYLARSIGFHLNSSRDYDLHRQLTNAVKTLSNTTSQAERNAAKLFIAARIQDGSIILNQDGRLSIYTGIEPLSKDNKAVIKRCAQALAYIQEIKSSNANTLMTEINHSLCQTDFYAGLSSRRSWSPDTLELLLKELAILNCPLPDLVKRQIGIETPPKTSVELHSGFEVIKSLRAGAETLAKQMQDASETLASFSSEQAAISKQIASIQEAITGLASEHERATQSKTSIELQLEESKTTLPELTETLAGVTQAAQTVRAEIEALKHQCDAKEAEINAFLKPHRQAEAKLQHELVRLEMNQDEHIQTIEMMHRSSQQLSLQLVMCQQQYAVLTQQIQSAQIALVAKQSELLALAQAQGLSVVTGFSGASSPASSSNPFYAGMFQQAVVPQQQHVGVDSTLGTTGMNNRGGFQSK